MATLKTCFKCNQEKPVSEFYKHPKMGDGHLGKCKECTKKDVHEHREKNIEKIREYDRERSKLSHRKEKANSISRKWYKEDSRRLKCHNAIRRAVKSGVVIVKPCIICGSEKSVAHHEDYDKPLDVIWLCQLHHIQLHHKKVNK